MDLACYLAYGSNLHPLRLAERAPSSRLLGTLQLRGFRLAFRKRGQDGSAKCDLVTAAEARDCAWGALYAIRRSDVSILDRVEGRGRGYEVAELDVPYQSQTLRSFYYRAEADFVEADLKPFEWYRDLVLLGAQRLGFPRRYLDAIRGVDCVADGDRSRRTANEDLVRRLRASVSGAGIPSSLGLVHSRSCY